MKYIPGEITGTMSGSIGAKTASHNKGGAYFRTKSTPTNPNTTRQQAIRSAFGSLVNAWQNTLTVANRAAWEAYAAAVSMTDKLGQEIYLSGQNHFIRSNTPRLQAGLAAVTAGPTVFNTGESVTSIELVTDGDSGVLGVNDGETGYSCKANFGAALTEAGYLLLYISPALPSSYTFYKGPYQLVTAIAVESTDSDCDNEVAFTAALNANGNPADGNTIGARFRITFDDGRLSQPFNFLGLVQAESGA